MNNKTVILNFKIANCIQLFLGVYINCFKAEYSDESVPSIYKEFRDAVRDASNEKLVKYRADRATGLEVELADPLTMATSVENAQKIAELFKVGLDLSPTFSWHDTATKDLEYLQQAITAATGE